VQLVEVRPLSNLEQQGVIHAFEFTHALAWNVLKDFFAGNAPVFGSKDATLEAFSKELIEQGSGWMDRIGSCNKTSHTYKWIFL
jgi:nucleotidyltransferase substrate binding protein (TIGR01987 family)